MNLLKRRLTGRKIEKNCGNLKKRQAQHKKRKKENIEKVQIDEATRDQKIRKKPEKQNSKNVSKKVKNSIGLW